jgi:hypothetical protein
MTTREISRHLEQIYGVEVGRDTVSSVTDVDLDDIKEWQSADLHRAHDPQPSRSRSHDCSKVAPVSRRVSHVSEFGRPARA